MTGLAALWRASFRNSSTLDTVTVVGHHGIAVVVHIQDQVLAHDCQTDQCRCLPFVP